MEREQAEKIGLAILGLVFDSGRQGDWLSDMVDEMMENGNPPNPTALAKIMSDGVGGIDSVAHDVKQVLTDDFNYTFQVPQSG